MIGPITTGPGSQRVDLYLSVDPFLRAKEDVLGKENVFTLHILDKRHEEGLYNNHPGVYQKVAIKAPNGMFLGLSEAHGGLLRADRRKQDASIFILDQTWEDHIVLHLYQRKYTWARQNDIPLVSSYLSTYFYSYGDHTYGSINPTGVLTPGSLLQMFILE